MILREPIWCICVDLRNLSLLKIWEQRKMNNTNLFKEIQVFRLKLSLWRDWMLKAEFSSIAWMFWLKKKKKVLGNFRTFWWKQSHSFNMNYRVLGSVMLKFLQIISWVNLRSCLNCQLLILWEDTEWIFEFL